MRLQCRIAVHALVNFYFIDSGQLDEGIGQALHNLKCSTWNIFGLELHGTDLLFKFLGPADQKNSILRAWHWQS